MKQSISFTVAPYALFDVIEALTDNEPARYKSVHITKEDNQLLVIASREQLPLPGVPNVPNVADMVDFTRVPLRKVKDSDSTGCAPKSFYVEEK